MVGVVLIWLVWLVVLYRSIWLLLILFCTFSNELSVVSQLIRIRISMEEGTPSCCLRSWDHWEWRMGQQLDALVCKMQSIIVTLYRWFAFFFGQFGWSLYTRLRTQVRSSRLSILNTGSCCRTLVRDVLLTQTKVLNSHVQPTQHENRTSNLESVKTFWYSREGSQHPKEMMLPLGAFEYLPLSDVHANVGWFYFSLINVAIFRPLKERSSGLQNHAQEKKKKQVH